MKQPTTSKTRPYVMVDMTEEEREALRALAKREHRSMAAQLRMLAQRATEREPAA
jgi:hypothetical protein